MRMMARVWLAAILSIGVMGAGQAFDKEPLDHGETVEPYPLLTKGIKLQFAELDKQYLGRRCSVYFKTGQSGNMGGMGEVPEKMFIQQDRVTIENGELTGLSKHAIEVTWFSKPSGSHGGSIPEKDIDYIIVEEK